MFTEPNAAQVAAEGCHCAEVTTARPGPVAG